MRSNVAFLPGCSEQALDRQPAQQTDFDALRKTGLGLGVEADFLATLASHPPKPRQNLSKAIDWSSHAASALKVIAEAEMATDYSCDSLSASSQ